MTHKITLIEGDGVGPEITRSALEIIAASGVSIDWDVQLAGKKVFESGLSTGVTQAAIDSIKQTKVLLKGPLETPIGHGDKSANVTLRKIFETFGNIRPAKNIPGVKTRFSEDKIDLILVRENVEGLYTGVEHHLSGDAAQTLKAVSYTGMEKIVRLAFEVARTRNRKRVTCVTKANIMKISEGMLKTTCETLAKEYPQIEYEHMIVDNCAHQLVVNPEQFDVMVMTNLNGDILSDLCSGLVGGLGFAPSANYGNDASFFEAVHGSAPTIAGQNIVNPTSLILSSILMLEHIGEFDAALRIQNALHQTFLDGVFTTDVKSAKHPVSTTDFTAAIIANLDKGFGKKTQEKISPPLPIDMSQIRSTRLSPTDIKEIGLDVTVTWPGKDPAELGSKLQTLTAQTQLELKGISNRGLQVFPVPNILPELIDSWQCRFLFKESAQQTRAEIAKFMHAVNDGVTWSKFVKLLRINGKDAFSKAQGES